MMIIVVFGFPGSGKSCFALKLAPWFNAFLIGIGKKRVCTTGTMTTIIQVIDRQHMVNPI